jgi:ElaB/YqjD/DUF883 family membrane-anchored ribosome-binding protein
MAQKKKDMMNDAKDKAEELQIKAKANLERAKKQLDTTGRQVSEYVAENPMKSVVIAAAAGAVIGSLWTTAMNRK